MSPCEGVITRSLVFRVIPEGDIPFTRWRVAVNLIVKWVLQSKCTSLNKVHRRWYTELKEKFGFTSRQAQMCYRQALAIAKSYLRNKDRGREPRLRKYVIWIRVDDIREVTKEYVRTSSYGVLKVVGYPRTIDEVRGWRIGGAFLVRRRDGLFLHLTYRKRIALPRPTHNAIAVDVNVREVVYGDGVNERRDSTIVERVIRKRMHISRLQRKYRAWRSIKHVLLRIRATYKRIRNALRDYVRKEALRIVRYARSLGKDTIILEDLSGLNGRQAELPKRWRERLQYSLYSTLHCWISWQAVKHGLAVIKVPPRGTSTTCPNDGARMVEIGHRYYRCPRCSFEGDRDSIAVLNLLKMGGALTTPTALAVRAQ